MSTIIHLIRSMTPIALRRFIWKVGDFLGRDLDQHKRFPSIDGTLRTLSNLGLKPNFCIDVGAYRGEWTALFKSEFPGAKILMVEAQDSKFPHLKKVADEHPGGVNVEIALLGATDDTPVNFSEMETGSSVFAEQSPYERTSVEKRTCRLDSLVARLNCPKVDFLKLDVQGYELEILKGAPNTLAQVTAVLMEASLIPINRDCPVISEVIIFMDKAGFTLFDFCGQIRRKDGVLWQTDLLFLKSDAQIRPAAKLTRDIWN